MPQLVLVLDIKTARQLGYRDFQQFGARKNKQRVPRGLRAHYADGYAQAESDFCCLKGKAEQLPSIQQRLQLQRQIAQSLRKYWWLKWRCRKASPYSLV